MNIGLGYRISFRVRIKFRVRVRVGLRVYAQLVLLRCHFFQGRSVFLRKSRCSVSVSVVFFTKRHLHQMLQRYYLLAVRGIT